MYGKHMAIIVMALGIIAMQRRGRVGLELFRKPNVKKNQ